jgi:hypothetical protein
MVQKSQNIMLLWILDGALVSEKSVKIILDNQNMLSVSAQIKLTEMWKASNGPQYPIKIKTIDWQENAIETISTTWGDHTELKFKVAYKLP